jgi:S1-C subfamily serine protease
LASGCCLWSCQPRYEGIEGSGLVIVTVEESGPADRAGLLIGDVLIGAADEPLADVESLLRAVSRAENTVLLRMLRGGKISVMNVALGEAGQAA